MPIPLKENKVYARVPDLDGCITTEKTLADAVGQMENAMTAWLCVAEDEDLPIPSPTPQQNIAYDDNDIISLYKSRYGKIPCINRYKSCLQKCINAGMACFCR